MSEINYAVKSLEACRDFMNDVKDAENSIKNFNDIHKIKKPSTIEECHLLIDGLVVVGIMNNRVGFLGKIKGWFK